MIKGAERQHFLFAADARPAFFGPVRCFEFLFLGQRQVKESRARLEEGERGGGERVRWRQDGGPSLVRERRLVAGEDLGEGNGDQGEGAGGRWREGVVGFCRVDDFLLFFLLLMTVVVATLRFGFAAERVEEFVDDGHDGRFSRGNKKRDPGSKKKFDKKREKG